jgi:hypothetical protein
MQDCQTPAFRGMPSHGLSKPCLDLMVKAIVPLALYGWLGARADCKDLQPRADRFPRMLSEGWGWSVEYDALSPASFGGSCDNVHKI